jgi:hypothetical protein
MWLNNVINNFFDAENFINNFIKTGGFIIAIYGVWKAVNAFKNYEKKRDHAIWSFYVNLRTFLYQLELTIGNETNPSPVTRYFYKSSENNASEIDKMDICNFRALASSFLNYLSTSSGQIPPSTDFENWRIRRFKLINFLHKALSLGLKIEIEENNLRPTLKEIHKVIKDMGKAIDKKTAEYESKIKDEAPQIETEN